MKFVKDLDADPTLKTKKTVMRETVSAEKQLVVKRRY